MPKIRTEQDKIVAKKLIREKAEELIKEIGLKNVTITNICQAVPIGKGTFYYYYPSKEMLLYEIIMKEEQALMQQIIRNKQKNLSKKENIIKAITEIYIGKDSFVNRVTPEEIKELISRLPQSYQEEKVERGMSFFEKAMNILEIDSTTCEMRVVGELLDSINFIASRETEDGDQAKKIALQIIIDSLATYMTGKQ